MEHKCQDCGKVFKWDADLRKHKSRKTPCKKLIPCDVVNKPQCENCGKIFSNQGNLNKHLKICKVNKEDAIINREMNNNILKLMEQNKLLMEKVQKLESKENQTINNIIVNNNVIVFATIEQPKIDNLQLTLDDAVTPNIGVKMIEKIYFNEDIPENHIIFASNKKEKEMKIYRNPGIGWISGKFENLQIELNKIIEVAREIGIKKFADPNEGLVKTLEELALQPKCIRENIELLTLLKPICSTEDVFEVAKRYKDMIESTRIRNGIK